MTVPGCAGDDTLSTSKYIDYFELASTNFIFMDGDRVPKFTSDAIQTAVSSVHSDLETWFPSLSSSCLDLKTSLRM